MPRLSIIIPCLGGAAEFDGTLVSVLQNRPPECEVFVAHTDPYDDPYGLTGDVRFLHLPGASLVRLINAALEKANSEVLHIVGCGLEVNEGWTEPAVSHFDDPEVAAVSPLVVDRDHARVIAAGLRYSLGGARRIVAERKLLSPGTGRLRASILGPTLAAAFYRRDVLAALGGLDESLGDRLADVDLALAIRSLGRLHICEPRSRIIQSFDPWSTLRVSVFQQARGAERLFWRYARERGSLASLAMHPLTILADLAHQAPKFSAITTLVGRAVGALESGSSQRAYHRLALAKERLAELATLRATIRMPASRAATSSETTKSKQRRAA